MTLWKEACASSASPTDGGNRRRAGNLSGHRTEGARRGRDGRSRAARRPRALVQRRSNGRNRDQHDAAARAARRTRRAHGAVRRLRHADPLSGRASSPSTSTPGSPPGLFDVSHMGQALLEGADHASVAAFLETLCPADILNLAPGRQRYTQLLNDDGGIVDDLMVDAPARRGWRAEARRQRLAQGRRLRAHSRAACPRTSA